MEPGARPGADLRARETVFRRGSGAAGRKGHCHAADIVSATTSQIWKDVPRTLLGRRKLPSERTRNAPNNMDESKMAGPYAAASHRHLSLPGRSISRICAYSTCKCSSKAGRNHNPRHITVQAKLASLGGIVE